MSAVSISKPPPRHDLEPRAFSPGSVGWCAADLDDPNIEQLWFDGRHEMIEGVLTTMPPAYFTGGSAPFNLMRHLQNEFDRQGIGGQVGMEIDIIINPSTVVIADAVFMSDEDNRRQNEAVLAAKRTDPDRTRILVPPSLIVESISPGHERHDQKTKRRLYAEFGVPRYWLLNAFTKTLECLELKDGSYETRATGSGDQTLNVHFLTDLRIPLATLWRA